MADAGVRTPDLAVVDLVDEIIGNRSSGGNAGTIRIPVQKLAQQMAAEGPIKGEIEAAADVAASAVQKAQNALDIATSGLKPAKAAVRLHITTDKPTSDMVAGAVVQGLTLVAGDRYSRSYGDDAGNPANGIYVVQAAGPAQRAPDMSGSANIIGARWSVSSGLNANTTWAVQNTAPIVSGTPIIVVKTVDVPSDVVTLATTQTIEGAKTFSVAPAVPDNAFTTSKVSGLTTALSDIEGAVSSQGSEIFTARDGKPSLNDRLDDIEGGSARPSQNIAPDSDYRYGILGALTAPTGSPAWGKNIPQLPEYSMWTSGTLPGVTLVDDQRIPQTGTTRALKVRLVRTTSGTVTRDVQFRRIFAIPKDLWGKTNIKVRLVVTYRRQSGDVKIGTTGLYSSPNADMSSATLAAGSGANQIALATGSWAIGIFEGTITDAAARYFYFGHRAQTIPAGGGETGGTSDVNEDAWLGPFAIYIDGNRRVADPRQSEIVADEVASLQNLGGMWMGDNAIRNATLLADPVGTATKPSEWVASTGGGGTTGASYQIVKVDGIDPPANGFKTIHYNDGSVRTDRQIGQTIAIPSIYWDKPDLMAIVGQMLLRSSSFISATCLYWLYDAAGNELVTLGAATKVTVEGATNSRWLDAYEIPIMPGARRIQIRWRLQMASDSTVVFNRFAEQSHFYVGFGKNRLLRGYAPNLAYDAELIARTVAGLASGVSSTGDVYDCGGGNLARVAPQETILVIGDSQGASYWDELQAVMGGRTVRDFSIGGEWYATHILERVRGHAAFVSGLSWDAGAKRLRTRRAVPPRLIQEDQRASWNDFGAKIAEPWKVEFFNADGRIGTSFDQERAACSVSGSTLTAAGGHPWVNGDQVYVLDASRPANMYRGKVYYVSGVSGSTFKLREFSGGPEISFSSFGGTLTVLGGFWLDWDYNGTDDHAISIRTYTDIDEATFYVSGPATNDFGGGASVASVKAAVEAIIAEQKTLYKRVIVETNVGFWDVGGEWAAGGARYNKMVALNDWILRAYPRQSIDTRSVIMASGNGSSDDNADIASGYPPRSLRVSPTDGHMSSLGNSIRAGVAGAKFAALKW